MMYSKRKNKSTNMKGLSVRVCACLLLFAAVIFAVHIFLASKNDHHIKRKSIEIKSAKSQSERHDDKHGTLDYSRVQDENASATIEAKEYNAQVDLPFLDIKKWHTVIDYRNKLTQVKKNKIFYDLIAEACPAYYLTSKVRGIANYRATETTSFYWVPYPDGIPCVVREVKEFDDFIQLELMVKDEATAKAVKNYYMDDAYVMHAFDNRYFSLVISTSNPRFAAMCDLNKDDVVTSKNWGNLFIINIARRGRRTPLHAGGMREKGDLFDVKFAILKAIQFESAAR